MALFFKQVSDSRVRPAQVFSAYRLVVLNWVEEKGRLKS